MSASKKTKTDAHIRSETFLTIMRKYAKVNKRLIISSTLLCILITALFMSRHEKKENVPPPTPFALHKSFNYKYHPA